MSKKNLPKPAGYRLLLKPREIENKTAGGIILTDELVEHAKFSCVISQIIDMGPGRVSFNQAVLPLEPPPEESE